MDLSCPVAGLGLFSQKSEKCAGPDTKRFNNSIYLLPLGIRSTQGPGHREIVQGGVSLRSKLHAKNVFGPYLKIRLKYFIL